MQGKYGQWGQRKGPSPHKQQTGPAAGLLLPYSARASPSSTSPAPRPCGGETCLGIKKKMVKLHFCPRANEASADLWRRGV